ncbi:hypothetical protein PGKDCPLP_00992 [Stenotrophomonas maltophilia]|nr:hypothetical protein PGKDCPLP_00992 [Stenotrophomonas maltophilia]
MLCAGVDLAGQGQRPLRRAGLASGQFGFHALQVVAVGIEHTQGHGAVHVQCAIGGHRAGILPLRRRNHATATFEAHVHAGVEGFLRIRALPGVVDDVLATALGQRAVQLVDTAFGQRHVAQGAEFLQVGPAQRAARLPTVTGDVELPLAGGVRRRRQEFEGVAATRIGAHRRGRPVAAIQIEAAVLGDAGAAQLAIAHQVAVVAIGVAVGDRAPVIKRLRAADGLGRGTGRVGRVFRIAFVALLHAAERLGHGAVGEGAAGQGQAGNDGQSEDCPVGQVHAGTPLRSVGNLAQSSHAGPSATSDKFEIDGGCVRSATRCSLCRHPGERRCTVHRLPHHCLSTRSTHRAMLHPRPAGRLRR